MNLNDLKKAVFARKSKSVEVPEWGLTVTFMPIGFHAGLDVFNRFGQLEKNADGGIKINEQSVAVFVDAIALSMANEAGERFLDSEDGRSFLREQSIDVLTRLTKSALAATGIAVGETEVKNSETPAATGA